MGLIPGRLLSRLRRPERGTTAGPRPLNNAPGDAKPPRPARAPQQRPGRCKVGVDVAGAQREGSVAGGGGIFVHESGPGRDALPARTRSEPPRCRFGLPRALLSRNQMPRRSRSGSRSHRLTSRLRAARIGPGRESSAAHSSRAQTGAGSAMRGPRRPRLGTGGRTRRGGGTARRRRPPPSGPRGPAAFGCYDSRAVLGGELAVPCTCNPLQQG